MKIRKSQTQKQHFAKRYTQRVGVPQSTEVVKKILRGIKGGEDPDVKFLDKQTNRVTRYTVKLEEKLWIVVYDKNRKVLVTIYPKS